MLILFGGEGCIIGASEAKESPSFASGSDGAFASVSFPWHLERLQTGRDGAGENPRISRVAITNENCSVASKASCQARVWLSSRALV